MPSDAIRDAILAAGPVIRRIVRAKLRASLSASDGREQNLDALDVLGDIQLKLLRRLSEDPSAIASVESYAAMAAYHACADYLRAKYPARTRIRNALRRTLEKTGAVWQASGDWICGHAGWRGHEEPASQDWTASVAPPRGSLNADSPAAVERLCRHVFDSVGQPVALDDLTAWIHNHTGGRGLEQRVSNDPYATDSAPAAGILDRTAASGRHASADAHWIAAERIRLLWDAIRQLLPWHRAAYLLNLREGELDAFPYYGVASIEDIRAALELDPAQSIRMAEALGVDPQLPTSHQFTACWRQFPIEDHAIAAILGVERSQVIAYRNKAIERLRRMLSALSR